MKNFIIILFCFLFAIVDSHSYEERGDSIIVKTFTFDSITARRGTFEFPPASQYERVIMHYTLKCDPRTTRDKYDCGEWDYLTYTVAKDTLGRYDSTQVIQYKYVLNNKTPDSIYQGNDASFRIQYFPSLSYDITSSTISNSFTSNDTQGITSALSNGKYILKFNLSESSLKKIDAIQIPINKSLNSSGKLADFTLYITTETNGSIDYNNAKLLYRDALDYSLLEDYLTIPIKNSFPLTNKNIVLIMSAGNGKELYFNTTPSTKHKIFAFLQENKSAEFNGNEYVEIPKSALSKIKDAITISFWAKGANSLPYDTQILEAVNSKNQRVLNIHLPWSNKRIYWDAGNDGGNYDRIDFEAADNIYKNEWAHWAFVKNSVTGDMKIYRNGEVIHSGTGKNLKFDEIERFRIASGATSSGKWSGNIDDFAIWDRELTQSEIKEFSLGATVNVSDMLVFYKFDNYTNINEISDESANKVNAIAIGLPNLITTAPEDYFRVFQQLDATVSMQFVEGNFNFNENKGIIEQKTELAKKSLFVYNYPSPDSIIPAYQFNQVSNVLHTPTDTLFINDYNNYTYDVDMNPIDTIENTKTKLYTNSKIIWYNPTVDYEIDRFITPYGIGLDLGDDGFTWKVDVTEFAPILNGYVDLSAGNDQELLDLQFIFIKGTPARNVNSIRRIWGSGGNYSQVVTNEAIAPITLKLDENSSMFRVITRSSGHGFGGDVSKTNNCSEFCAREHSLWINDSQEYAWSGWKECGDNPVYPQGGTWILDRTDWCPGAPVTTYRHELNNIVSPGENVKFDYQIENPAQYIPYGNWVFTGYLVEYGNLNFKNDAGIVEILSPSNHDEFRRFNPICDNGRILIANNGSNPITNIELKWKIDDKYEGTYLWEGKIPSLASSEITIPLDFAAFTDTPPPKRRFIRIEILKVNGNPDEYPRNNFGSSEFDEVENLYSNTQINLRTSDWSAYNMTPPLRYQITDLTNDSIIAIRESFENAKQYKEDLNLSNGCYEFLLESADGYGLSYWALKEVKSGGLTISSGGNYTNTIKTEFGNFYYQQFKIGNKPILLGVGEEISFGDVNIGDSLIKTIELEPGNDLGVNIEKIDFSTLIIKEFSVVSYEPAVELPYYIPKGEKLKVNLKYKQIKTGTRKATLLLNSNDGQNPNRRIDVFAYVGVNDVEKSKFDEVSIYGNPIKDKSILKIKTFSPSEKINISLYDLMGNKIVSFYDGYLNSNQSEFELNFKEFARGQYYIVVSSENDIKSLAIILE